ncbi:hypothetical protein PT285_11175 [Lactobacillus sp. ESL0791]|uniref:hypothetical protein n=1 Tax=Lactobacillus sp. ESL0791 TaxID=2983234 RepID=UPI0023F6A275|nr:hypothetical protein [Lactobacillus sp. ESL0791]MDF7639963.1 hypothetical protein [Lactobacillus sp. ESL0791]
MSNFWNTNSTPIHVNRGDYKDTSFLAGLSAGMVEKQIYEKQGFFCSTIFRRAYRELGQNKANESIHILNPAFITVSGLSANNIQKIMNMPSIRADIMKSNVSRESYTGFLVNAGECAGNAIVTYDGLLQDYEESESYNQSDKVVEDVNLNTSIQISSRNVDWVAWFKKLGNQIIIAKGNSLGVNDNNGKQSESTTKFIQSSPKPIQPFLVILLRWFLYISVCIDIDTAAKWLFEVLHWLLHFLGF